MNCAYLVEGTPPFTTKEGSKDFAGQLLSHLIDLSQGNDSEGIWTRAEEF
ncbi:hypothetical protein [Vibrio gallicus]|nr:hypothetical protein [Vibrio gallicus]